jgi:hypothetical protein
VVKWVSCISLRGRVTIDIIEIATRHGPLLERILAKSTGALGEILVADLLLSRGYDVRPTNNNARQSDLIVTPENGLSFSIEVKSDRQKRPTWFVRQCPDVSVSAFWCFVSAPRAVTALPDPSDAEIFVLTSAEAHSLWMSSDWNQKNPQNGDIRRWQIPDDALSAWHKLPASGR